MGLENTAGVWRLDDRAVLRISGDDARTWLQGQITNDVGRLSPRASVYALVVDVRGKVQADLHLMEHDGDVMALVPGDGVEALLEHFDRYIVMEDVDVEAAPELAVVTVQGPKAEVVLAQAGLTGSAADRLGHGGADVLVPADAAESALERLAAAARAVGGGAFSAEDWTAAHLRTGWPRFGVDFGPANYPQEAGLKDRALSFTKGCYVGQEVVCTLENRGKLKKRLVRLSSAETLAPETELAVDGKAIGRITSAGTDTALGYVKRAHAAPGTELQSTLGPVRVLAVVGETAGQAEAADL